MGFAYVDPRLTIDGAMNPATVVTAITITGCTSPGIATPFHVQIDAMRPSTAATMVAVVLDSFTSFTSSHAT
jgi:hypothetical protein